MPAFHPGAGEGGVVDQAHFGEPAQDGIGDLVRDPSLAQRGGQLRPRARPTGKQPQADKPRRLLAPGPRSTGLRATGLLLVGIAALGRAASGLPVPAGSYPAPPGSPPSLVKDAPAGSFGTARRPPAPVAGSLSAASASRRGPTPSFSLIFFSISLARSGLSRRKFRAFSLPCPSWSPS